MTTSCCPASSASAAARCDRKLDRNRVARHSGGRHATSGQPRDGRPERRAPRVGTVFAGGLGRARARAARAGRPGASRPSRCTCARARPGRWPPSTSPPSRSGPVCSAFIAPGLGCPLQTTSSKSAVGTSTSGPRPPGEWDGGPICSRQGCHACGGLRWPWGRRKHTRVKIGRLSISRRPDGHRANGEHRDKPRRSRCHAMPSVMLAW